MPDGEPCLGCSMLQRSQTEGDYCGTLRFGAELCSEDSAEGLPHGSPDQALAAGVFQQSVTTPTQSLVAVSQTDP